jgi:hypothetical protein
MARVTRTPMIVTPTVRACVLALACAPACRKDEPPPSSTATDPSDAKPPRVVADPVVVVPRFDRIVPRDMPALGVRDGLVDGAMIHAGVRLSAAVPWLRRIPLPSDVARDLAQFSEASGIDWRAEDLERRFALTDGAVVTMSLLRPLDEGLADLQGELGRGGSVLDGVAAARRRDSTDAKPAMPEPIEAPAMPEPIDGKPLEAPTIVPADPLAEPAPPPVDVAVLEAGRALLERASGLGLHSRFAVPVTDPRPIVDHLRARVPASSTTAWAEVCAAAGGALCFGDDDVVAIVRGTERVVTLDVLLFVTDGDEVTPTRRKAVLDAVGTATASTAPELRGDAAAEIDAAMIVRFAGLDAVRRSISAVAYDPDRADSIRRLVDGTAALQELTRAPQLFRGARLAALADGEDLHLELRWLLVPGQADAVATAFAGPSPGIGAPVPTLAALCDGSLFCFRTAGLPRPSTLAERLGVGPWSRGPDAAERETGRSEDAFYLHVVAASWPNFLGSIARLPSVEFGSGPEAAIARNVVDMIGRVEGTGGSVRSASMSGYRASGDYVVYARTTATDAGVPKAMLSLAGQSMGDVTLPGDAGVASAFTIPEDELPATLMARTDPPAAGSTAATSGWLALVDGPDRMAWLLGLPSEAHAGPGAYVEIPDLGRLVAVVPDLARELAEVMGFLERRSLRLGAEIEDGEVVVRGAFVRTK